MRYRDRVSNMVKDCLNSSRGFSLLEVTIALLLLASGLLAAGQLIFAAASSGSLARSKTVAAVAAQERIERLSALYDQNPSANELATGDHGPQQSITVNPIDGKPLNVFNVYWSISEISDPRPGIKINARLARVTVVPIRVGGAENKHVLLNKVLSVSSILSGRMP
jgi:prepilin-type N-terminal cleavage/methylation domain-containing protein